MKIFIAAGHGGSDPGSLANGVTEAEEARKVADEAVEILKQVIKPPNELILVPHELALGDTVRFINERMGNPKQDICLELHFNNNVGAPGTGTETYYGYKPLADKVHLALVGALALKNRGVKAGNFYTFNRETEPFSALVEIGFLNNPGDLARIRAVGALAFAKGIAAYLGLELSSTPEPPQPGNGWREKYEVGVRKLKFLKEEISKILVQV